MSDDELLERQRVYNWCRTAIFGPDFRDPTATTDEQLIACLEVFAVSGGGHQRSWEDFRNELTRREREREGQRVAEQSAALIRQTEGLVWLTKVLSALTGGLFVLELLRIAGA